MFVIAFLIIYFAFLSVFKFIERYLSWLRGASLLA